MFISQNWIFTFVFSSNVELVKSNSVILNRLESFSFFLSDESIMKFFSIEQFFNIRDLISLNFSFILLLFFISCFLRTTPSNSKLSIFELKNNKSFISILSSEGLLKKLP